MFLWRFPDDVRNYPGWNCTADKDGCRSLLDLFALKAVARWGAKTDIALSTPTGANASLPGCGGKWLSAGRLRLHYPKGEVTDNLWRWDGSLQSPTLTIAKSKLDALWHAFESVAAGRGDFCIRADDQKLHGFDPERMAISFW